MCVCVSVFDEYITVQIKSVCVCVCARYIVSIRGTVLLMTERYF